MKYPGMQWLLKPMVFLLCLWPAGWMSYAVYTGITGTRNLLGPDPAKALALFTGEWAIRILIIALALTPLRHLLGLPVLWSFRRMLGLFALFYACLHFLVFLAFLLEWRWSELGTELLERPYITIGFLAWVLMLPLGMTSFQAAQRYLGKRWKQLHRAVYAINILAVLHVVWIVRSSIGDAVLYGGLVILLLGYRILRRWSPSVRKFSLLHR